LKDEWIGRRDVLAGTPKSARRDSRQTLSYEGVGTMAKNKKKKKKDKGKKKKKGKK
jgi:hypothetical protein